MMTAKKSAVDTFLVYPQQIVSGYLKRGLIVKIKSLQHLQSLKLPKHISDQVAAGFALCEVVKQRSKSKFNNEPVIIDGIWFQSKSEGRRYTELKLLQKAGEVISFKRQVSYIVVDLDKKKHRYKLDFLVKWSNGSTTYEDVKGFKTSTYELKKSLMEEKHGITITEIRYRK
jgi:hypothetical protein